MADKFTDAQVINNGLEIRLKFKSTRGDKKSLLLDHNELNNLALRLPAYVNTACQLRVENRLESHEAGADSLMRISPIKNYTFFHSADRKSLVISFRTEENIVFAVPFSLKETEDLLQRISDQLDQLRQLHRPDPEQSH